jgi:hypothetical protein
LSNLTNITSYKAEKLFEEREWQEQRLREKLAYQQSKLMVEE